MKKDEDKEDPFTYLEFNPYSIDETSIQETVWKSEFVLNQKKTLKVPPPASLLNLGALNGISYKPVNPENIVDGTNNNWASQVKFNIDLIDNYQARVFIRDNELSQGKEKL